MFFATKYADHAEKDIATRDVALAKRIGEAIDQEYPNHFFRVEVDSRVNGGIATIKHPLMPPTVFFVLKLRDIFSDPGMRLAKKAAGELLERVNQRRGKRHEDEWAEGRQKHHRGMHGFHTERNWKTGETRHVMQSEWSR